MESDFLEIRADVSFAFEITFMRDGEPRTCLLRCDGSDWRLNDADGGAGTWIANGRTEWHEALRRALKLVAP